MASKSFEIKGVSELLKAIDGIEKGKRKVIAQAVNKAATGAKTDAVTLIRQQLMLKAKPIRDNLRVVKATWSKPQAILVAKGKKGLPLLGNYPVRPGKLGGRKPKDGVSVQIKKRGSRKVIRGSFLAKMKSGHVGVFKRSGGKRKMSQGHYAGQMRQPVRQMHGVGFIGYLERGMIQRKLSRMISTRLETNLMQSINFLLQQNLKRIGSLKG